MAWWNNEELDRPVLFNSVPKPKSEWKIKPVSPRDDEEMRRFDLDAPVKLYNARCTLENTLYLAESAPSVTMGFGNSLGLLCVMAGGRLGYDKESVTVWLEMEPDLFERPLPEKDRPCKELDFIRGMINRYHEEFGFDGCPGG
jgi:hypothetical protein